MNNVYLNIDISTFLSFFFFPCTETDDIGGKKQHLVLLVREQLQYTFSFRCATFCWSTVLSDDIHKVDLNVYSMRELCVTHPNNITCRCFFEIW